MFLLEECENEKANERETYWIAALASHKRDVGYNRTMGGWEPLSQDVRDALSKARRGKKNPMFGKTHTPEVRARMSLKRKGRPHSPEHVAAARAGWLAANVRRKAGRE